MRQRAVLTFGEKPFSPFTYLANDLHKDLERDIFQALDVPQFVETEEAYLASVDMPGVNASDINIELEDKKLIITASRTNPLMKGEQSVTKYSRVFTLPKHIEEEQINAHYENGVLSLTLPKMAEDKTKKKIQVITDQKPKAWTNFLNFKKEPEKMVN